MNPKTVIALLLLVLVALFCVQNAEAITVRFLIWNFAISQALVIILSAFCGGAFALVIAGLRRIAKSSPAKS